MNSFILKNVRFTKVSRKIYSYYINGERNIENKFEATGDLFCVLKSRRVKEKCWDTNIYKIIGIEIWIYTANDQFDRSNVLFKLIENDNTFYIDDNSRVDIIEFITDKLISAENFLLLR